MADGTGNAADKASWLRLAESWLGLIKNVPSRGFGVESRREDAPEERPGRAWPDPSDEDSKASH